MMNDYFCQREDGGSFTPDDRIRRVTLGMHLDEQYGQATSLLRVLIYKRMYDGFRKRTPSLRARPSRYCFLSI